MNAAAGGGSFVSVPALIYSGVPSVSSNMSSTIALFPGSFTSAWVYRGRFLALLMMVAAAAGGYLGAHLAIRIKSLHLRIGIGVVNFLVAAAFFWTN
jgi:uncharacterized protein